MDIGAFLRFLGRRWWLIPLIAGVGAIAALATTAGQPKVYERVHSFVIRPSDKVAGGNVVNTLDTLSERDSAVIGTIVGVLESARLHQAAERETRGAAIGAASKSKAVVRPGTTIVDLELRGRDPNRLAALGDAMNRVAPNYLSHNYGALRLDFLGAVASRGPVAPKAGTAMVLAGSVGALLALGLIFLEASWLLSVAQRRRRKPTMVWDQTGRTDRLEQLLRERLQYDEQLVRTGDRLHIMPVPKARQAISSVSGNGGEPRGALSGPSIDGQQ